MCTRCPSVPERAPPAEWEENGKNRPLMQSFPKADTSLMDAYTGESAWIARTREGLPTEARGEQEERRLRYCVIRFLTEQHIPERLEDIGGKHVVLFFTGVLGRRAASRRRGSTPGDRAGVSRRRSRHRPLRTRPRLSRQTN
jgi:hypothetical protein